jgi:two-component system OmpR family response regulator
MRILIVEDDAKLARILVKFLREERYDTDACASGNEALVLAGSRSYVLITLDWCLPDLDGLAVCRELRKAGNSTPILMLSARQGVEERVLALEQGVDDYLVKPFEFSELLARIRALLRRTRAWSVLRLGELQIDPSRHEVLLGGRVLLLQHREYQLLLYLAGRADQPVSRAEALANVWATEGSLRSNLVDVTIKRLRDKLGEHAWMIETVAGQGYRLCTSRQAPGQASQAGTNK